MPQGHRVVSSGRLFPGAAADLPAHGALPLTPTPLFRYLPLCGIPTLSPRFRGQHSLKTLRQPIEPDVPAGLLSA